ncbi:TraG family conjugative transposon ATPase [Cellulophaga sp. BC115SP]|uniref:TraG family conjugative transposon ATPase n=1 Tax=Cellulophaga sp. BC115SP TaxID=2683263 RepID=UPI001412F8CA|nr:TraG family conjugative transposon ATPase [Cellulophaga sp. BC115SP]NBB29921.1 TraG family conjugative transposon ATPase [Cellulophaga sp. BC115SP]
MNINLSEQFPIIGIEPNLGVLISRNGDITLCYEAVFSPLNSLSSEDYTQINENFRRAFTQLPTNTLLHAQTYFTQSSYESNTLELQASQESYLGQANERLLFEKSFKETKSYLYFTLCNISPQKKNLYSNGLFSGIINLQKRDFDSEKLEKFVDGVSQYLSVLGSGLNFSFRKLNLEELEGSSGSLNICERYLMLTRDAQDSIKEIHYRADDNILQIGQKRCGIFNIDSIHSINDSISSYINDPKLSTEFSFFPSALCKDFTHKIDGESIYNVVIYKEDVDACKEELRQLIKTKSSLFSFSEENRTSMADTEEFLRNLVESSGRLLPVRFYSNLIFWTEGSIEDFKQLKTSIHTGFKKRDLIPSESSAEMPIVFMNTMPGNAGNIGADQMVLTYNEVASCFLNFEETSASDGKTAIGFPMLNRNGARTCVDIFAESGNSRQRKAITGYNFFCLGPTGSGKSVTMNSIIRTAVESGAFVMVVDVGHSYEMLCKHYFKGSYFSFDIGQPVKINPFKINGDTPGERRVDMILKILLKAWKGEEDYSKLDENILLSSIMFYYNYLSKQKKIGKAIEARFDTYYEYMLGPFREKELPQLNTSQEFRIEHFLDVMKIFYTGGVYEEVLNGHYDIDLRDERLIVFELDNIKGNKVLFPLIVLYMMGTFEEVLKEKKNQRKYLVIEEAWKAIMTEMFAEYIKEVYKTARKSNGTIGLVTQELNDIISNDIIKDTVISQSDIKLILSMAKYATKMEAIAKVLSLQERHVSMILSMNRDLKPEDKYRELFIYWTAELYGVYGLSLSAKEYWTYTTEAKEKNLVKYLMQMEFDSKFPRTLDYLDELSQANHYDYYKVIEHCDETFNYQSKIKSNPHLIR